jgi:hypothetical protein
MVFLSELDCRLELAQLKEENKLLEEVINYYFFKLYLYIHLCAFFRLKPIYNLNVFY